MTRIEPLAPSNLAAFEELFGACASPCFCRYWHFGGDKNAWLARCAHDEEESRIENAARVHEGHPEGRGLLALEGERAVGWMKLAPRPIVSKLRRLPVYRGADLGDDEGVHVVGCFLVRPERRRRGIARLLLASAPSAVRAWGGRALEAYPRRSSEPMHDEERWMGPLELFLEQGFVLVAGEGPYPVLRKTLT